MAAPTDPKHATFPVTVHRFSSALHAYELASSPDPKNALVFIGGLGDGPHTVPYIRTIAKKLESSGYSVIEIRTRSSYSGYGFSSLAQDVEDISMLVKYLRGLGKQKIVLMGHSTGSQDCIEYTNYERHHNEPVDGYILQGPVSDREAITSLMEKADLDEVLNLATEMIKSGRKDEIMPREKLPSSFFSSPITAYRLHSLTSFCGGDDFFSSDLPDDRLKSIWGRIKRPILVVPSGEDEHVPKTVDVAQLVAKWKSFCPHGIFSDLSELIPGASHAVRQAESQEWLADRVGKFLDGLND